MQVHLFCGSYRRCKPACFLVTLAFAVASFTAIAAPIYTDDLQLTVAVPETVDDATQTRAARIERLTDYIQQTYRIGRDKAVSIVTEAVYNGAKHNVYPELILAIIAVESSYREQAVSHAGARGLMQIMPTAHPKKVKRIGGVRALFNPKKNISTGVQILNEYLSRSEGNLRKALLRYNGSISDPKARYSKKVMGYYRKLRKIASVS